MLAQLIPYVSIRDHRPGDLDLKFSLAVLKRSDLKELLSLAGTLPGIREFNVNLFSRTLSIAYDPGIIGYDFWEAVLSEEIPPEKRAFFLDDMRERLSNFEA